jgi:hypothetical protein
VNWIQQLHEKALWHLVYIKHVEFLEELRDFQLEFVENGGSTVLRNDGIQPPHYTAQQPRKLRILTSTAVKTSNLDFRILNKDSAS